MSFEAINPGFNGCVRSISRACLARGQNMKQIGVASFRRGQACWRSRVAPRQVVEN